MIKPPAKPGVLPKQPKGHLWIELFHNPILLPLPTLRTATRCKPRRGPALLQHGGLGEAAAVDVLEVHLADGRGTQAGGFPLFW